jgi:hypothetical protein
MKKGYAYNPLNPTHPCLDFVGKISPSCENETCCSCVLINKSTILTAWHCLSSPCGNFCVQFPKSKPNYLVNFRRIEETDIAIAFLAEDIEIHPISVSKNDIKIDEFTILSGYGINEDKFDLRFGFAKVTKIFDDKMLCDDQHGLSPVATLGDSGGPVLVKNNNSLSVVGIISKSYNDSHRLPLFYSHIQDYCNQQSEQENKCDFFDIENKRRLLFDTGFLNPQNEDWIDIDNWILSRKNMEK